VTDETAPDAAPAPTVAPAEPGGPAALARPKGWLLGYPTDHLMGVLPSPEAAASVIANLERAGIAPDAIRVLVGEEAALRIDGRGTHHGILARLYRLIQFTQMDQAPDFRRYEHEARRGHPVAGARVRLSKPRKLWIALRTLARDAWGT